MINKSIEIWSRLTATGIVSAQHKISINVSPRQFASKDFVNTVISACKTYDVEPRQVTLELTESLFSNDQTEIVRKMNLLCGFGFTFAMDDFGTGYSSLSRLGSLPLKYLKIDRAFTSQVLSGNPHASIVKAIIAMGVAMDMSIIAEGVEDIDQMMFMRHFGAPVYQGYLYSKPLSESDFAALIKRNMRHHDVTGQLSNSPEFRASVETIIQRFDLDIKSIEQVSGASLQSAG